MALLLRSGLGEGHRRQIIHAEGTEHSTDAFCSLGYPQGIFTPISAPTPSLPCLQKPPCPPHSGMTLTAMFAPGRGGREAGDLLAASVCPILFQFRLRELPAVG